MDYFKSQLERVREQLGGLTATQKMLTGTLVAVMLVTLVWWARYAGQPEMVPLLTQTLSDEELSRITLLLDGRGIKHEETADKRVLVPADKQVTAIAALSLGDALPKNTANGFDEIIKQLSPWDGQDRQNMMFNRGKEMTLARVIGEYPDVASATVMIDPKTERHIDGNLEPTAFVSIRMKPGARRRPSSSTPPPRRWRGRKRASCPRTCRWWSTACRSTWPGAKPRRRAATPTTSSTSARRKRSASRGRWRRSWPTSRGCWWR